MERAGGQAVQSGTGRLARGVGSAVVVLSGHRGDRAQGGRALEYATDDFGIAQLPGAAGDAEKQDRYLARSANWVNTFNLAATWSPATARACSRLAITAR